MRWFHYEIAFVLALAVLIDANTSNLEGEEAEEETTEDSTVVKFPPAKGKNSAPPIKATVESHVNLGRAELSPDVPIGHPSPVVAQVLCHEHRIVALLKFAFPFKGYIYPEGQFGHCHLFTGNGETSIRLEIEQESCGVTSVTSPEDVILFLETTVVIQWEREMETQKDQKLKIICNNDLNFNQSVNLGLEPEPFVSMEVDTDLEEEVDDEQGDMYDVARVGDEARIIITLARANGPSDIAVEYCKAHDGNHSELLEHNAMSYYNNSLDLIVNGCSTTKKMSEFTSGVENSNVVLTAPFKVFRFPSRSFIFIECRIKVCLAACKKFTCPEGMKEQENSSQTITLFRPISVSHVNGFRSPGSHDDNEAQKPGMPTASFIAGLIGMGFVCAIVCVFMYHRFRKGPEKDYKAQYNVSKDPTREEVSPLKITTGTANE